MGRRAKVGMMDETKAERRNEDQVHLGVAEEPEQVLPEQYVAAFGRIVEVRARRAGRESARCCRASPQASRTSP